MQQLFDKRAVFLTGKGGVGRTTVAAALAKAAAAKGKRVLIGEMGIPDQDYSPLGHLFGHDTLPEEPVKLAPGISGVMLWSRRGHERFLRMVLPVPALVKAALNSGALRRMLDATPSLNELGVFYHMLTMGRMTGPKGEFDLFIIDLPATGHALALAQLPDNLLAIIPTGPIARAMHEGTEFFFNADTASMYVVTLPEVLPVTECIELIEGLSETAMPVGGVLVNKVLADAFTADERQVLDRLVSEHSVYGATRYLGLSKVDESLAHLSAEVEVPIYRVPERPEEGPALIEALAHDIGARP